MNLSGILIGRGERCETSFDARLIPFLEKICKDGLDSPSMESGISKRRGISSALNRCFISSFSKKKREKKARAYMNKNYGERV